VQKKPARKGDFRVKRIREHHKALGYTVDNRPVSANGVDLVCHIRQDPSDPNAICIDGEYYPEEIIKVFEVTNWNKDGWMSVKKAKRYIKNLEEEADKRQKAHPKACVLKILVVSYYSNVKKVLHHFLKTDIYLDVWGFDEEPEEEQIEGWVE